jgi:hypothetical protein
MRRIVFLSILFIRVHAYAQEHSRAFEFFAEKQDCASSLGGWKCLELDLSFELAGESDSTKQYEYSWSFGDGKRFQGKKVEHCYEAFGSYQVTMDLLDMETNTVIRNELLSVVYLYPEIHPSINVSTEGQPPTFFAFSFNYNEKDNFSPDRVFWRIDGQYYEGNAIVHSFPVAGSYLVEMGVEKDMGFLGTVSACATREVLIDESDAWTRDLYTRVEDARDRTKSGPFTRTEVFCILRDISSPEQSAIGPVSMLMRHSTVREGRDYEVVAFSGNQFTITKQFTTKGIMGRNIFVALQDTVAALFATDLTELPSLRFRNGQKQADTTAVRRLAQLLNSNPRLTIEVGSYMHTGSRFAKGVKTSIARSSIVKDQLVQHGVSADRISIASPEYNRALVNTCSALGECDWGDPELNGKIEFKITGSL